VIAKIFNKPFEVPAASQFQVSGPTVTGSCSGGGDHPDATADIVLAASVIPISPTRLQALYVFYLLGGAFTDLASLKNKNGGAHNARLTKFLEFVARFSPKTFGSKTGNS
jgi:hypothetical protein